MTCVRTDEWLALLRFNFGRMDCCRRILSCNCRHSEQYFYCTVSCTRRALQLLQLIRSICRRTTNFKICCISCGCSESLVGVRVLVSHSVNLGQCLWHMQVHLAKVPSKLSLSCCVLCILWDGCSMFSQLKQLCWPIDANTPYRKSKSTKLQPFENCWNGKLLSNWIVQWKIILWKMNCRWVLPNSTITMETMAPDGGGHSHRNHFRGGSKQSSSVCDTKSETHGAIWIHLWQTREWSLGLAFGLTTNTCVQIDSLTRCETEAKHR